MRGAGLRRYVPPQDGGGFIRDVVRDIADGVKEGIISGYPNPAKAIKRGVAGGRAAAKTSVKRKAEALINQRAKRALNDIFG